MDAIENSIKTITENISNYFPKMVGALLALAAGFIVAGLVRKLLIKCLNKLNLDEKIKEKSGKESKLVDLLSSIGYFSIIVFTIVLTLDILGIQGALDPVQNMVEKFFEIVPNVIAFGLICFAGYILAQICNASLCFATSPLDKYSSKVGLPENFKISVIIGKVVSVIVFIPIMIAALDALKIEAISQPATAMLNKMMGALPNVFAAIIILVIAYTLGKVASTFIKDFLKSVNADSIPEKLGVSKLFNEKYTLSGLISAILFVYIMLGAFIAALDKLELENVQTLVANLIHFFSQVIVGLIILAIGTLITNTIFNVADDKPSFSVKLGKIAVHALIIAMALNAMGVADTVVNMAFGFIFGAIAVAFALAFGLGGREEAGKQMKDFFQKLRGN